ncbi:MAG: Fic family protein [Desulfoarculaceae bacterium]|nr:Fic family protein [Desulfoarculaceae bacterium]
MKKSGRYDTSSLIEGQYEPGSRSRVLKNLLGIKRKREMDMLEAREQLRAYQELLRLYSLGHCFTAQDICRMHKLWLGNIYSWAGALRQVNISKGAFTFAMASQVPKLLQQLEDGPLAQFTPCRFSAIDTLAHALAVLMGLQAGLQPLDFDGIRGAKKQAYFAAVQAGMDYNNYQPMEQVFKAVVERTLRAGKKV